METTTTLPDKPSELLALALADLEKCERDPRYEIDMDFWVEWNEVSNCTVCLSGAMMVQTLDCLPDKRVRKAFEGVTPHQLPARETRDKLLAVNAFRMGWLIEGMRCMCSCPGFLKLINDQVPEGGGLGRVEQRVCEVTQYVAVHFTSKVGRPLSYITDYRNNPTQFKSDMRHMIAGFAELGL